ncbi:MAG: T9SS type A sorting domain-containing protein [Bacteroidota bacterium]|nr:T9SS type A sorting domain-containing protein [Bacteroidota bacterium]
MKHKTYIFLIIALSLNKLSAQVGCASASNVYSFTANGINYELIKEAKTWTAAASCAVQRGGYLVEINNQTEQTAVYNAILTASIANNYSPVSDGGGASYIWIGATDKQAEGVWLWDGNNDNSGLNFWTGQGQAGLNNGNVMAGNYVNWGGKSTSTINEPDDFLSDQDVGAIALNSWPYGVAGEWNDISSSNSLYYIIEYANTTNILEKESESTIQFFPNPTKDNIEIKSDVEIKEITLISIDGQVIKTELTKIMNLKNLKSGIYFLNITTKENKLIVKKIVKE